MLERTVHSANLAELVDSYMSVEKVRIYKQDTGGVRIRDEGAADQHQQHRVRADANSWQIQIHTSHRSTRDVARERFFVSIGALCNQTSPARER
jgi:hypothetical protein